MAAVFGGSGNNIGGSLNQQTGLYTYADGSTYQNPYKYGDSWSYVPGQAGQAVAYADVAAQPQMNQTKPDVFNGGGQGGAAAVGNISSYTAGQNPYLQQQGDALTKGVTNNLRDNVLPAISASSIANGNFGGSRQGVIEANALNDANGQIASGLASLYGNGYNNALQYDLGRRSQDQSYNLGMGNLGLGYLNSQNNYNLGLGNLGLGYQNSQNNYDLGLRNVGLGAMNAQNNYDLGLRNNAVNIGNLDYQYANLDRQIYNDNSNRQLQGAQLGLQAYNQGQQNNQGAINAGTNIQNTPFNYWSQFANGANSIGNGYGTTTGSSSNQGNPFLGALGGAQLGASIFGGGSGGGSFDPFGLISF